MVVRTKIATKHEIRRIILMFHSVAKICVFECPLVNCALCMTNVAPLPTVARGLACFAQWRLRCSKLCNRNTERRTHNPFRFDDKTLWIQGYRHVPHKSTKQWDQLTRTINTDAQSSPHLRYLGCGTDPLETRLVYIIGLKRPASSRDKP